MKSIFVWIIKVCLFAVPFIPLYIATDLVFPFITGKAFVFRALIEIAFSLWLVLAIFYKEYRPQKTGLLLALSVFILIVTLATVLGVDPLKSFWSNFERMEGLIAYLHLFAYFLVLGNVFKKLDWFVLFNLFVVSGLVENVYGLSQVLGKIPSPQGGFRIDGTVSNPAYLAAFLIFIAGFCAWLFINSKNKYLKIYYALVGIFSLAIIYFTASRGPALGILLGVFAALISYLLFKKSGDERGGIIKKIVFGVIIFLAVIAGSLWVFRASSFIQGNQMLSRLTDLSSSDINIAVRYQIWNMSWQGFKARPILGWGPENQTAVFFKYYRPEMREQQPWFDRSHNIILDWLISAGILGLLSYLSIFVFAIRALNKNYRGKKIIFEEYILIIGIFVAYFFQNLFLFDNIATYIPFFAILAWIYSVSIQEERAKSETDKAEFNINGVNYFPLAAVLILSISFFYFYFITVKPYLTNKNMFLAIANRNDYAAAFDYFKAADKENTFLGRDEIKAQFVDFLRAAAKEGIQLDEGIKK